MRINKIEEKKKSIIELEKELLKEDIRLSESEKENIYNHLNNEISDSKLIDIIITNSK